jgi:hypothetical protein
MTCPGCGKDMGIDEWSGWVWACYYCDSDGRLATAEEIKRYEAEMAEWFEENRND